MRGSSVSHFGHEAKRGTPPRGRQAGEELGGERRVGRKRRFEFIACERHDNLALGHVHDTLLVGRQQAARERRHAWIGEELEGAGDDRLPTKQGAAGDGHRNHLGRRDPKAW